MSKYCYNCGAALEEGKPFCGDCGARQAAAFKDEAEARESGQADLPAPKAPKKKKRFIIALIAAAVLFIGAAATAGALILGSLSNTYETPVKNMYKGMETGNYELYLGSMLGKDTITKDAFDSMVESLKNAYGDRLKITCLLHDKTALSDSELDILRKVSDKTFDKGFALDATVTAAGEDREETFDATIRVVQSGGKWYVCSISLKGRAASAGDAGNNAGAYEAPIKNLIDGINAGDYDAYISAYLPALRTSVEDERALKGYTQKGYIVALASSLAGIYGPNVTLSYSVSGPTAISDQTKVNLTKKYNLSAQPEEGYTVKADVRFDSDNGSQTKAVTLVAVKVSGTWYLAYIPSFLEQAQLVNNNFEAGDYQAVFQTVKQGLVNQDFNMFESAFIPNYFYYKMGYLNGDKKIELLHRYLNKDNYSAGVSLAYTVLGADGMPAYQLEPYQAMYSLNGAPSAGYSCQISWVLSDGATRKTSTGYAEIIKVNGAWYLVRLDQFHF